MKKFFFIFFIGWFGLILIVVNVVLFLFGLMLVLFGQEQIVGLFFDGLQFGYLLGFDQNGWDMLLCLFYGVQILIGILLVVVCLLFLIGVLLGILVVICGGWLDLVLLCVVDMVMLILVLILVLVVLQVFGLLLLVLIVIIVCLDSICVFCLLWLVVQGINVMEYVEVVCLCGEGLGWMICKEILFNVLLLLVVEFGMCFCFIFLFVVGLFFLGLGVQLFFVDWGGMVCDNQQGIFYGFYVFLFFVVVIVLVMIGVNLIVDWLLFGCIIVQGDNR